MTNPSQDKKGQGPKQNKGTRRMRMLDSQPGSPDGVTVINYKEGRIYEMPAHLAGIYEDNDWAEEAPEEHTPEEQTTEKAPGFLDILREALGGGKPVEEGQQAGQQPGDGQQGSGQGAAS